LGDRNPELIIQYRSGTPDLVFFKTDIKMDRQSQGIVYVDGTAFPLFLPTGFEIEMIAYSRNEQNSITNASLEIASKAVTQALLNSNEARIVAKTESGHMLEDVFSLVGFDSALNAAQAECGR